MRKQEEDTFCSVSLICFCFINWTLTPCLAQALGFWNTLGFDLGYYSCRMKSFIGPLHPICQACLLCVWWGSSLTWAGAKLCFGSACSPLLSPFCQRVRGGGFTPLDCSANTTGWCMRRESGWKADPTDDRRARPTGALHHLHRLMMMVGRRRREMEGCSWRENLGL